MFLCLSRKGKAAGVEVGKGAVQDARRHLRGIREGAPEGLPGHRSLQVIGTKKEKEMVGIEDIETEPVTEIGMAERTERPASESEKETGTRIDIVTVTTGAGGMANDIDHT